MKLSTKIVMTLALILIVIGTVQVATATEQSQQFAKIYMDPLYRQGLTQATNYSYSLTVDTPDGVSSVASAMLTMQIWMNPTINFYVWVDGQACNTPTFQVHTTYANAGEGTIFFDCSNIIIGEGVYNVTLQTDDNTGASTFWADITYSNSPRPQMTFGGTDYFTSEPEQLLFVQLIGNTEAGAPIDNAVCFADVYTSDTNSHILEDAPLVHTEHGIYHLHTNIVETGVHIVSVECFYEYNETIINVSSTITTYGNYERLPTTLDYNFFDYNGGTINNYTSQVNIFGVPDATNINQDWANKYTFLNTTGSFKNGDLINMYYKNNDNIGDNMYIHNAAGTIIYATMPITQTATKQWHNITLANIPTTEIKLYISDLNQGGAHKIDWDYIQIIDSTGGGWSGDPSAVNPVSALTSENGIYWQAVEDASDRLNIEYTFTGITGVYNDSASLFINGKWTGGNENLNVSMYNYNTSTWTLLPNPITFSTVDIDWTNTLNNFGDYVSAGSPKEKIEHTATNIDYGLMELDAMHLETFTAAGNHIQDVKGGGEIHIINVSSISNDVWAAPDRQLTALNFDTTDEEAIWEYQGNVSVNLTNQFTNSIWSYTGTITNNILTQIANSVWLATTRTLTAFSFFDYTVASDYVWNSTTNNRTLLNEQNLSTITTDEVWAYNNRTLTTTTLNTTEISDAVWNNSAKYTNGVVLS